MGCRCDHPFFCHATGTRRSAWETPACLTAEDWRLALDLAQAARVGCAQFLAFFNRLSRAEVEAVCHRVIGYPEAISYLHTGKWAEVTFYEGFMKHQLMRLEAALSARSCISGEAA